MSLALPAVGTCLPTFRGLGSVDLLGLLAIVIALSAYLATVRQFLIETSREKVGEDRTRIRKALHHLFWADMPMTASAVLLGLYALFNWSSSWILWIGESCFVFAGGALLCHHFYGWYLTWKRHEKVQYLLLSLNASEYTGWRSNFDAGKREHKSELGRVFCEGTGAEAKKWILTEFKANDQRTIDGKIGKTRTFLKSDAMKELNGKANLTEHLLNVGPK